MSTPSHSTTYQWQMTRLFIEINGSNYIKPWNYIAAVAVTIKFLKRWVGQLILLNWFNCLVLPYNLRCDTWDTTSSRRTSLCRREALKTSLKIYCSLLLAFFPSVMTSFFYYNFSFSSLVCLPISHPNFCLFSFLFYCLVLYLFFPVGCLLLQHKVSPVQQAGFTSQMRIVGFMSSEISGNESRPSSPAAKTGLIPAFSLTSSLDPAAPQALFPGEEGSVGYWRASPWEN